MTRVRHYTRKSAKDKILRDGRLEAKDQNKVFVEHANANPYGPQEAVDRYKLKPGKGNAYVEFDADDDELEQQTNPLTGRTEYLLRGDVKLAEHDPEAFENH